MTKREQEIIDLINREVKPALGCTEPIAVALAVAKAVEILADNGTACSNASCSLWRLTANFQIDLEVSGNILKNAMGVGIPGTGMIGLPIAATLGAVCGHADKGLEVLQGVNPDAVARARKLLADKRIKVKIADTEHLLYVKATVRLGAGKASAEYTTRKGGTEASAVIEDDHDKIVRTTFEDKILMNAESAAAAKESTGNNIGLTVKEIHEFALTADYQDIKFILEDRTLNLALAKEGLAGDYGLRVGKSIRENQKEVFGDDFMSYAMGLTAAASDARMAGCTMPAMSNSGSGNQGITVSMPVIAYALRYNIDDERLARALILSNLVAIHIKSHLGKLSALCGCVIASTGSSCGIVYLRGGGYEQICAAIKNMVGNITGMVCDGAKVGCAMKVASGVSSAVQSSVLAMRGICASETDGIIDKDIEKTIRNLGLIGSRGMRETDKMILDIMICK
ncbi:MAG: L-serine ammonia-lyase, iron-sulfur-dependent, subunit alpha [Bacteroidales bacterium]|nr:L-serine ammonia-lyase, iron-sulfur-dependent, subunit alpha [Bacteroidales bacterium]